jgi:hypothetical protein
VPPIRAKPPLEIDNRFRGNEFKHRLIVKLAAMVLRQVANRSFNENGGGRIVQPTRSHASVWRCFWLPHRHFSVF